MANEEPPASLPVEARIEEQGLHLAPAHPEEADLGAFIVQRTARSESASGDRTRGSREAISSSERKRWVARTDLSQIDQRIAIRRSIRAACMDPPPRCRRLGREIQDSGRHPTRGEPSSLRELIRGREALERLHEVLGQEDPGVLADPPSLKLRISGFPEGQSGHLEGRHVGRRDPRGPRGTGLPDDRRPPRKGHMQVQSGRVRRG